MINTILAFVVSFLVFKGLNWIWNKIFKRGGN